VVRDAGAVILRGGVAHHARRFQDLRLALHRARPRHHHQRVPADRQPAGQAHQRVLGLPLARDLLVGLSDVDDFQYAVQAQQPRCIHLAVIANQADRGALLAGHGTGLIAHFFYCLDDSIDLAGSRRMRHHNQHSGPQ